ncbi:sulfotransferase domain-containing protein [Pseudotamlana agarivorans]|uniref:sulfotransferase domain-containing protein n=1 Tax=Pseudotamlana agarivorans TaxID=481183 RepID=UPI000832733A|nr:sulfotransferase domain-containing protein [Tamlana agarivorans]
MLIVAIPKSASSSLLTTLGKLHNLVAFQDFSFRNQSTPIMSNVVHTVHSDIRELTRTDVDRFCRDDVFYKQHIFPSENNLNLLKDRKKVILLRDSSEILLAYKRGAKEAHNGLPEGYSVKLSNKVFLEKAKRDGFNDDLEFFKNKWLESMDPRNTLVIYYKDYINNTNKVINEIEHFFNLTISNEKIIPVKARYSRVSSLRKRYNKLKKFIKSKLRK